MREVTFFSLACVWPSVSSHVWDGSHFLVLLITVFYILLCWGGAGHCSTLQSCQASAEECALCLFVPVCVPVCVCVCVCVCVRFEGGVVKGSWGHLGLDVKTPGLEARAQVHHCRQWKALQKAIWLSVILASAPQNPPPSTAAPLLSPASSPCSLCPLTSHPASFNYHP